MRPAPTSPQLSPEAHAGWPSRLVWAWVTPTLKLGKDRPLTEADLMPLGPGEDPAACADAFAGAFAACPTGGRPVLRTVVKLNRPTIFAAMALSLLQVAGSVLSPLLLRALLQTMGNEIFGQDGVNSWARGLVLALGIAASALIASFATHHTFFILLKLVIRVRASLIALIYQKSLNLTIAARQRTPAGQIINLMGTDAQKFANCLSVVHGLLVSPLQILLVLTALINVLGPAALVGTGCLVAFLAVSALIARYQLKGRERLLAHTDERVSLMNEVLIAIRALKFYSWEASFRRLVAAIRDREIHELRRLTDRAALGTLIYLGSPVIVMVATFATHIGLGHQLTAADVFASLALFAVLRQAMITLPDLVNTCLEANVAVARIEDFLAQDELKPRPAANVPPGQVTLLEATFEWTPGVPALEQVNLAVPPGSLVVIIGPVGAGKSALLAAILGDLELVGGEALVGGRVAFVAQQAWIMNDTIKNNILFGRELDAQRYRSVLAATCLEADLRQMADGDQTEIGERGINLSGGQRQRIALARAIYDQPDILLLDDPLSALDHAVGDQVYRGCLKSGAIPCTRILVTHRLEYATGADLVIRMQDATLSHHPLPTESPEALPHASAPGGDSAPTMTDGLLTPPAGDLCESGHESVARRLVDEEERATGKVAGAVYKLYRQSFAPGLVLWAMIAIFVTKDLLGAGTDFWLAHWARAKTFATETFLAGYLALGIATCIATWLRSRLLARRGLLAGNDFHDRVLASVLRAPLAFFESTPVGRILNRFARDQEALDQQIPRAFHDAAACIFAVLTTLATVVIATPFAMAAFLPMGLLYYRVQVLYRPTAREGQRIDSITRSPIFALFAESLAGVPTIRAFDAKARLRRQLLSQLTLNARAFYTLIAANRWLGIRTEGLGTAIIATAALAGVLAPKDSGLALLGLSISYALSVTGTMNWAVRMVSQLESSLNSVERLDHYTRLPSESWSGQHAPKGWPSRGAIHFKQFTLRYRPGLAPALRDFTCDIAPGEKVGIVGRTGAGKSSILLGLFRMVEPTAGSITIDGIDITSLNLVTLRTAMTIIPQEPTLLGGTLRDNLDPAGHHSEVELLAALDRAALGPWLATLPKGLATMVYDGGGNFSVGQRQLLCLARAILRRSRILLLDEATSHVDSATDRLIRQRIAEEFSTATVITIAHRLTSVLDLDRIIVLDHGRLVEIGAPRELAAQSTSAFARLLHGQGAALAPRVGGKSAREIHDVLC